MGQCPSRRRAPVPSGDGPTPAPSLQEYCANLKRQGGALANQADRSFPMFVVRISDFLTMTAARPHQALRSEGVAVEYVPELGVAIFVSHQWCGKRHPDPSFHQLSALQGIFRNAPQGKVKLQVDLFSSLVFHTKPSIKAREIPRWVNGCIWYDYFSIPQPGAPEAQSHHHVDLTQDLGKAVMSIPAYVDACELFFVLAPPVPHADRTSVMVDYPSWKRRGWCRLERVARVLSPNKTHMLLVLDEQTLVEVGSLDYLVEPAGEGEYSVPSDRERLAPVLVGLLANKLQALLNAGDLHRYRHLLNFRTTVLRGLPGVAPLACSASGFRPLSQGDAVDRFLHLNGFRSATDLSARGVAPILFAAVLDDHEVVRGLIARRASLDSREPRADPEFLVCKGFTALHAACGISNDPSFIRLLLDERADLEARDAVGNTPLVIASLVNYPPVVNVFLAAEADINARNMFNANALQSAACHGRVGNIPLLLAAGMSAAVDENGIGPLWFAVCYGAGADTVTAVLAAPDCDVEAPFYPRSFVWRAAMGSFALPHRLWGSRTQFAVWGYHSWGATPLAIAAIMGSVAEARVLVAAGASTTARNAYGKTAADLAEMVGLSPENVDVFRGVRCSRKYSHDSGGTAGPTSVHVWADDIAVGRIVSV